MAPDRDGATGGEPVRLESPPCGLCGGLELEPLLSGCSDSNYWTPGPRFGVWRCGACGLAQTRPRPTRASIGRYYPGSYGALGPPGRDRKAAALLARASAWPYRLRYGAPDELESPPRQGIAALDVGAGTGEGMERAAALGWEPWGIEPDPVLAERIVARGAAPSERVIRSPAERAELPAGAFGLVVLSHSLEHMHDPRGALRRAREWLSERGELRVWVPNFESWERRLFGCLWIALDLPRHLFHFGPGTLAAMVEDCGFRVERLRPQFRGQSLSGTVAHSARRLGGRRPQYRAGGALYWATLPADRALTALGARANLELVARPA